jgi:hypothetical protein
MLIISLFRIQNYILYLAVKNVSTELVVVLEELRYSETALLRAS